MTVRNRQHPRCEFPGVAPRASAARREAFATSGAGRRPRFLPRRHTRRRVLLWVSAALVVKGFDGRPRS